MVAAQQQKQMHGGGKGEGRAAQHAGYREPQGTVSHYEIVSHLVFVLKWVLMQLRLASNL